MHLCVGDRGTYRRTAGTMSGEKLHRITWEKVGGAALLDKINKVMPIMVRIDIETNRGCVTFALKPYEAGGSDFSVGVGGRDQ